MNTIKELYPILAVLLIVASTVLVVNLSGTITGEVYKPGISGLPLQLQENIRQCWWECDYYKTTGYEICIKSPQDPKLRPNYCREITLDKIEPCKKHCEKFLRASWYKDTEPHKKYRPMKTPSKRPSVKSSKE